METAPAALEEEKCAQERGHLSLSILRRSTKIGKKVRALALFPLFNLFACACYFVFRHCSSKLLRIELEAAAAACLASPKHISSLQN